MTNREIKDLMRFFDSSDMSKLKIKNGDFSIELQKGFDASSVPIQNTPQVSANPVSIQSEVKVSAEEKSSEKSGMEMIKSPMVGTFYVAPSPGAEPFVKVGDVVRKGQSVGIIEAMKIMNEIEAEFDCKIVEVLVRDGEPVEFDMPLFGVERV